MSKTAENDEDSRKSWYGIQLTAYRWLKPRVDLNSIVALIRQLKQNNVNVIELSKAFDSDVERKFYGLICVCDREIKFDVAYDISGKAPPLIPKTIKNADLTIDLLNIQLAIENSAEKNLNILHDYAKTDASNENENNSTIDVQWILPIAFAHNITAKTYPADENDQSKVYSFVVTSSNRILQIGEKGKLLMLKESDIGVKAFGELLRKKCDCTIYAVVKDEMASLNDQLQKERQKLEEYSKSPQQATSSTPLNETLTIEDLAEISALSEELENAEDFALLVDSGDGSTLQLTKEKTSEADECTQIERKIRELMRRMAAARKDFPHLWWESGSVDSVYTDPEYPKFAVYYSRVANIKTPIVHRSPALKNLQSASSNSGKLSLRLELALKNAAGDTPKSKRVSGKRETRNASLSSDTTAKKSRHL